LFLDAASLIVMQKLQVFPEKGQSKLQLVERPIPEPKEGEVLLKVEACGICHSDLVVPYGILGTVFPRCPGHEIIGKVHKLGSGVTHLKEGQRVGVGWHGYHCSTCRSCRKGDFITCERHKVTGFALEGGYAQYTIARAESCARVPDELSSEEAAPLMCAGLTVYNSLRHMDVMPGELVAVQGLGGLGHLAVQYAHKMGFITAAISSGADKEELARKLGADYYIDGSKEKASEALLKLGGAKVVVATAPSGKLMSEVIEGLGVNGTLLVLGASQDPINVSPNQMIGKRLGIRAWPSGSPIDAEETLFFSAKAGIKPMIEVVPLEKAQEGLDRVHSNKARFRVVIKP